MTDPVIAQANTVLAAAREELTRADGKASLLLAVIGVVMGALLAALLAGSWDPSQLSNAVEWLWWLGVLAAVAGVAALGFAVYPRTRPKGLRPTMIAYFGDVVATPASDLEALLEETAKSPRDGALDQLRQVSGIVHRKYQAIRVALWALAGGAIACGVAVLINLLLR